MTLPIEKILVLSTMHISKDVAQDLPGELFSPRAQAAQRQLTWYPSWSRPEGWMFYVPPHDIADERYKDAPLCLQACVNMAREAGCNWLMLDRDGEVLDGLPAWEW